MIYSNTSLILHKFPMYSIGDLYGDNDPYIKATCIFHIGKKSASYGFVGILLTSELSSLKLSSLTVCSTNPKSEFHIVNSSAGFIERNIEHKGVYNLIVIACGKNLFIDVKVEALNPHGYLGADQILLIPVRDI